MPSPKSGTPGSLVAPLAPDAAQDADVADPGEVEKVKADQQQGGQGKYGSQEARAYKKPTCEDDQKDKPSWIAVVLKDEDGHPVAGAKYQITLPDESVQEGTLDEKGCARVEGIAPGNCKITFPDLHPDAWSAG